MRRWWWLLGLLPALWAGSARAQVLDLQEAPWAAVADTAGRGGADLTWERGLGGEPRWRTDRLGLTLRFPVGARAVAYLRGSFVRLDVGDQPVLGRWPDRLADEPEIDAGTWPGETLIKDFAQPEVGLLLPMRLPLLGPGDAALQMTTPFGKDESYPLSSRALVLRLDWRRHDLVLGPVALGPRIGWEIAMDASGDVFDEVAFPDGLRFGVHRGFAAGGSTRPVPGLGGPGTVLGAPQPTRRGLGLGHHRRGASRASGGATGTGGAFSPADRLARGARPELRRPVIETAD